MTKNHNKYSHIASELRERIFEKKYALDHPIPDELTLAKEFDCSRMTMKKALEILVLEGLLYRKRGHGTFIIKSTLESGKLKLLSGETKGLTSNVKGKKVTSHIIHFELEFPNEVVQESLHISKETPIYHIIRLRFVDNEPYVIEETYMPTALITGITEEVLLGSIYEYIQNKLKFTISSSHKSLRADKPNALDQQYLNCQTDDPVLVIEQVVYLNHGVAFEYSISRHHYDKFIFKTVNISRT